MYPTIHQCKFCIDDLMAAHSDLWIADMKSRDNRIVTPPRDTRNHSTDAATERTQQRSDPVEQSAGVMCRIWAKALLLAYEMSPPCCNGRSSTEILCKAIKSYLMKTSKLTLVRLHSEHRTFEFLEEQAHRKTDQVVSACALSCGT